MTDTGFRLMRLSPSREEFWRPFGTGPDAHDGFNPDWWSEPAWPQLKREDCFFALCDETGRQVARLKLGWDFPVGVYPTADEASTRPMLGVEFIEVHQGFRHNGLGTLLVELAQAAFPERQLVALSEDADGFWESLGWSRHLHCKGAANRPLYLAP